MMNLNKLLSIRFKRFAYEYSDLIIFGCFSLVMIIVDFLGLAFSGDSTDVTSTGKIVLDWLTAVNGILIGVYSLIVAIRVFGNEVDSNIVKMDQHAGFKNRDIFLSRIIEAIILIGSVLVLNVVINMIIIGAAQKLDNYSWYRFYCISLGWYALIAVIMLGLTTFLVSFIKGTYVSIISTVVLLVMTFFAFLGGSLAMDGIQKASDKASNEDVTSLFNDVTASEIQKELNLKKDFSNANIENFISEFKATWDVNSKSLSVQVTIPEIFTFGRKAITNPNFSKGPYQIKLEMPDESILNKPGYKNILEFYNYWDKFFDDNANKFNNIHSDQITWFSDDSNDLDNMKSMLLTLDGMDSKYSSLVHTMKKYFIDQNAFELSGLSLNDCFKEKSISDNPNINYGKSGKETKREWLLHLAELNNVPLAKIMFFKDSFNIISTASDWITNYDYDNHHNYPSFGDRASHQLGFNPLVQFSAMFNGVNYRNLYISDLVNNNLRQFPALAFINESHSPEGNNWDNIQFKRVGYPELVYLGYTAFNVILVFLSYLIFRKKIKR